ncbi:hypothetical protein O181_083030 [Austropuccinia psidii MF-1]|uniref:Uncharacterized protein n=1 Tax=Austropuccinia psidii MF-1 TaxID=1389203 RepID=A0A9Q3FMC6_9BASI|nr:hypothetical protein [Austropuccinia psidii MF-1]
MPELLKVPKGSSSRDIPVSVQELLYGGKAEGVGASAKVLEKENKVISSSGEAQRPRKDAAASSRMYSNFLQRESLKDKGWVGKPKHGIRGLEEGVGPKGGQHPCGSSPILPKEESASMNTKKRQKIPKDQQEGKAKLQMVQALPS